MKMPRFFFRTGPWLFVAAVACYAAGNFFIKRLEEQSLEQALSQHKGTQHFEVGPQGGVVIRAEGESFSYRDISVGFNPTVSQATVQNEILGVSTQGQLVDGVLHITLSSGNKRLYGRREEYVRIVLPSTVTRLQVSGSFEVSGSFPNPASTLSMQSLGCRSGMKVKDLTVHQLKLSSTCQADAPRNCCSGGIHLEAATISELDVSMSHGPFTFEGTAIPHSQLHLGDTVKVSGGRAFLEAARFDRLPATEVAQ